MSWAVEKRKQALKRWALMTGWPCIQHWLGRAGRMEKQIGMELVEVRRAATWPGEMEARYGDGMRLTLRWVEGQPVVELPVRRHA